MKDILLVNMFSKNESSYTEYYIRELEKADVSYDSIYFERYNMDAQPGENEIFFKRYCPTGGDNWKKINTMLKYAHFVRKVIGENQYKGIIVFTTVPAVMISDILLRKYKFRYLLDIRDYTHEGNKTYYGLVDKLVSGSFATVISSRGFLRFLPPERRYYVTHNIAEVDASAFPARQIDTAHLHIGFVGSIRYYDENCELIRQFANQEQCSLDYYGTVSQNCDLESFCRENDIQNVNFHGRFINSEKQNIYKSIDVINSIYGIKGLETITAIPNRLYDAAIYKCPIIVSKGTYLEEVVEQYGLGFAVDIYKDNVPDMLKAYLSKYDSEQFAKNCSLFLMDVYQDMEEQKRVINAFAEAVE